MDTEYAEVFTKMLKPSQYIKLAYKVDTPIGLCLTKLNMDKGVFRMKKKDHRTYSVEFKEYVTKMVVLDGHSVREICEKLDVPYGTLRHWVQAYKTKQKAMEKEGKRQLLTATEYKELYEKERRDRLEIEEENDILKKAMHIFTQEKK